MDIKGMQYDVRQKLNKIDSSQFRNLSIPELDWKLNEALDIYIKNIAFPKNSSKGVEDNQRTTEDLRPLMSMSSLSFITKEEEVLATLPKDYMLYVNSKVEANKNNKIKKLSVFVQQHEDLFEGNSFYSSSFEWGEINMLLNKDGLKYITDKTFTIENIKLNYLKKHPYLHNAQDFSGGSYTLPDGTVLTGSQSCELPEHTHREIVDLAVLIVTGDLQIPDYNVKLNKVQLNK